MSEVPAGIVTDANLWLHAAIPNYDYHAQARSLLTDCLASGVQLLAPVLWEAETDSSLNVARRARHINAAAAKVAFQWIDAAPVDILHHPNARALARSIAEAIGTPRVYDATYAALAHLRACPFWTADERFYNAVQNALVAARKRRRPTPFPDVYFGAHYSGAYALR